MAPAGPPSTAGYIGQLFNLYMSVCGSMQGDPAPHDVAEDSAEYKEGNVDVGKATQHPHRNDKGDHQVDGKPPS